jgi:hypothetical protein
VDPALHPQLAHLTLPDAKPWSARNMCRAYCAYHELWTSQATSHQTSPAQKHYPDVLIPSTGQAAGCSKVHHPAAKKVADPPSDSCHTQSPLHSPCRFVPSTGHPVANRFPLGQQGHTFLPARASPWNAPHLPCHSPLNNQHDSHPAAAGFSLTSWQLKSSCCVKHSNKKNPATPTALSAQTTTNTL